MHRTTLTLVLVVAALLAGCAAPTAPAPSTETSNPTTAPPTDPPATGAGPDEPPLDFDGADSTLEGDDPPHVVRLTNDGDATKTVHLRVARDGTTVFDREFRSFPNTTVLGQLDHVGNYTLTVTVVDGDGSVTETVAASSFDCNYSTTTFDLSDPEPTVQTVSTEMACGTAEA